MEAIRTRLSLVYLFIALVSSLSAEPLSTRMLGQFSPASGAYSYARKDLEVPGPVPLALTRFYNSEESNGSFLGYGHTTSLAYRLRHDGKHSKATVVEVEFAGGLWCPFKLAPFAPSDGPRVYYIDPEFAKGACNNVDDTAPSRFPHLKNARLVAYDDEAGERWELRLPDGAVKHYRKKRLQSEVLADGNRIHYVYNEKRRLVKIEAFDSSKKLSLGWLKFYRPNPRQFKVVGSNNRSVTYSFDVKPLPNEPSLRVLTKVEKSNGRTEELTYEFIGKEFPEWVVTELVDDRGRKLRLNYGKEDYPWLMGISVPSDSGDGAEWTKVYSMAYGRKKNTPGEYFELASKPGALTRYNRDKLGRVKRVRSLNSQKKVKSELKLKYGKTQQAPLLLITQQDSQGIVSAHSYKYDDNGNVVKERLMGNLTGLDHQAPHLLIGNDGRIRRSKTEEHTVYYTYTNDGRNLLESEFERDGTRVVYSYEPNRSLKTQKLVYNGDQCIKRSFFRYNSLGILTEEIHDDGSSTSNDDLAGITERQRRCYTIQMQAGAPGFGLPREATTSYYDISRGRFQTISRERYTYDSDNRVTSKITYSDLGDELAREGYEYDASGNLIWRLTPDGIATRLRYDSTGNIVEELNENCGCSVSYRHDILGHVTQKTTHESNGRTWTEFYEYDAMGNRTAMIDALGHRTDYKYDSFGRQTSTILPEVANAEGVLYRPVLRKKYDHADRVRKEIDAAGRTTRFKYNVRDQKIFQENPDGTTERWIYTHNGWLEYHVATDGMTTKHTHDVQGRPVLTETLSTDGTVLAWTRYTFSALHLLKASDSSGLTTHYHYDNAGNLVEQIKEGKGVYERIEYDRDALGRPVRERLYAGRETNACIETIALYDVHGRKKEVSVVSGEGSQYRNIRYTHDSHGNVTSISRDNGKGRWDTEHTCYDCLGRLTEQTNAAGERETYKYHPRKHKDQQLLACAHRHNDGALEVTVMDAIGRKVLCRQESPQGELVTLKTMRYDELGHLVRESHKILKEGEEQGWKIFSFVYDAGGHLLERTVRSPEESPKTYKASYLPDGRIETVTTDREDLFTYSYDPSTQLLSRCTSGDGSVDEEYTYDDHQRLVTYTNHQAALTLERTYDAAGRISSETLPNGAVVRFKYNSYGKISQITLPTEESFQYHYKGPDLSYVDRMSADGTRLYRYQALEHDTKGRVLSAKLPGKAGVLSRKWSRANRPIEVQHPEWSIKVDRSGYDAAGRLVAYTEQKPERQTEFRYGYSAAGQLETERGATPHQYAYDSLFNRIAKDGVTYKMREGNPESVGKRNYTYDLSGNIVQREQDGKHIRYTYNARNEMIRADARGERRANYAYDHEGRCLRRSEQTQQQGSWRTTATHYYLYCGAQEIGAMDAKGNIVELRMLVNPENPVRTKAVAYEIDGKRLVPLTDFTDNVRCTLDMTTGEVVQHATYSAFGEATGKRLACPWQYQGQRWDPIAELYRFPKRNYDPHLGRWTSADPLGTLDGPNPFAFVHNRPMHQIDPLGLWVVATTWNTSGDGQWRMSAIQAGAGSGYTIPISDTHHSNNMWRGIQGNNRGATAHVGTSLMPEHEIIKATTEGSCVYKIPGKALARGRIYYVNGMLTSFERALEVAKWISDISGGYEVIGIYNATHGLGRDAFNAALEYYGHGTQPTSLLAEQLSEFHEERPSDHKAYVVGHSKGALHVNTALLSLSLDARNRVFALGVGPAVPICGKQCYSATNIASSSDFVPGLERSFASAFDCHEWSVGPRSLPDPRIQRLPRHPNAQGLFDHAIDSPTVSVQMAEQITAYISQYGS